MSTNKTSSRSTVIVALSVLVFSALVGFAAVYVTIMGSDNAEPARTTAKSEQKSKKDDGHGGDLAAFVKKSPPQPLTEIRFEDGDGQPLTLQDFRGKTILLNLWATWCAPCKAEMPSLDRLQAKLGSDKFEVVALALDRKGRDAARAFLTETQSEHLKLYIDPTTKAGTKLGVVGMPATILIDREGRELGRLIGPVEWDSRAAIELVNGALN